MNTKTVTILSIAATLVLTSGKAQTPHVWDNPSAWSQGLYSGTVNGPLYNAQELSLDLFGSYENPERRLPQLFNSDIRRGAWGGGVGLDYFPLLNVGVGADVNLSDNPGRIVDQAIGDVILRAPLGNTGLAPYAVGSGGRGISPVYQWVYGGGVGLEFRFNQEVGIFSDARYLWGSEHGGDRLLLRAGLRIVF